MRRWSIALILCLFPAAVSAHPGKTDLYDGHKCVKKCEDWGLLYGEYHLHDKDRKPVRIAKKPKPVHPEETPASASAVPAPAEPSTAAPRRPESAPRVVVLREESVLPVDPLLLVLLALLILLLILRMNRRKEWRNAP